MLKEIGLQMTARRFFDEPIEKMTAIFMKINVSNSGTVTPAVMDMMYARSTPASGVPLAGSRPRSGEMAPRRGTTSAGTVDAACATPSSTRFTALRFAFALTPEACPLAPG